MYIIKLPTHDFPIRPIDILRPAVRAEALHGVAGPMALQQAVEAGLAVLVLR